MKTRFLSIFAIVALLVCACDKTEEKALFSWSSDALADNQLIDFMKEHSFSELYQWLADDADETVSFLSTVAAADIGVYMLVGEPHWGTDPNGEEMIACVEKAAQINRSAGVNGLLGIVFDVEPYLLDEWDKKAADIMKNFVRASANAYRAAAEQNLEVIICIPFHYDDKGFEKELKELIETGCDRVAVMNYYKGAEQENIKTEAAYVQMYNKELINIYEFQPPKTQVVKEVNTYYSEGFAAECFALMNTMCYRPCTVITYRRKAFVAKENKIRITFDNHIIGTEARFDIFAEDLLENYILDPYLVVLEVKYNGFLLSYIKDMICQCDSSEISVSKYCLGRAVSKHYVF